MLDLFEGAGTDLLSNRNGEIAAQAKGELASQAVQMRFLSACAMLRSYLLLYSSVAVKLLLCLHRNM
ncbi:hypothetical protein V6N12_006225 [Hibiscus sabdariffa]|uniref:Uncharacterized protein n=1 Tax=Hibiscus sabdariffa TaxID=183260 RepID=A0ABR2EY69_9ROSI